MEESFANNVTEAANATFSDPLVTGEVRVWNLSDQTVQFAEINNIVYYCLMYPVALLGNLFTLITVVLTLKKKKSVPTLLIGALATGDLISILVIHTITVASMVRGQWIGDAHLCRFQSVMAFSYFKYGFFSKVNVSIERFIALKFPLRYKSTVTQRRMIVVILLIFLFSVGSSALTGIFDPDYIHQLETWLLCASDFSVYTLYKRLAILLEGAMFFLGVGGFIVSDITIVRVMIELNKKLAKLNTRSRAANVSQLVGVATTSFTNLSDVGNSEFNMVDSWESKMSASQDIRPAARAKPTGVDSLRNSLNDTPRSSITSSPGLSDEENNNGTGRQKALRGRRYVVNPKLTQSEGGQPLPERYKRFSSLNKQQSDNSLDSGGGESRKSSSGLINRVLTLTRRPLRRDKKQARQQREIQYAKLVLIMVIVFIFLWIPYMVTIFFEHFRQERVHPLVADVSMKLVFVNATFNPILYGLFNANYRKAYAYYCRLVFYYLTCKRISKPSDLDLPWTAHRWRQRKQTTSRHLTVT